jgi:transcriptional regulator with XRE-family HTH domain
MKQSLGSKIKESRKKMGLTQRELAEAVGIDFTYLSKIENGNIPYSPSVATLKRLAEKLEIGELELLQLAGKLPGDVQKIAHSEHGLNFLRRAAKFKSPQEWEDLFTFLEDKERKARKAAPKPAKDRKGQKG